MSRQTEREALCRGTSLIRNSAPLGPCWDYASGLMVVLGGDAVSYERGTLVYYNILKWFYDTRCGFQMIRVVVLLLLLDSRYRC